MAKRCAMYVRPASAASARRCGESFDGPSPANQMPSGSGGDSTTASARRTGTTCSATVSPSGEAPESAAEKTRRFTSVSGTLPRPGTGTHRYATTRRPGSRRAGSCVGSCIPPTVPSRAASALSVYLARGSAGRPSTSMRRSSSGTRAKLVIWSSYTRTRWESMSASVGGAGVSISTRAGAVRLTRAIGSATRTCSGVMGANMAGAGGHDKRNRGPLTAPEQRRDTPLALLSRRQHLARHSQHGRHAALDVVLRRRPRGDADAHGGASLPHRPSRPARAVRLYARDDTTGHLAVAKGDQHLIDHHVVEDLVPGLPQAVGEARCMATGALDQVGQALPPQRAQRRPHLDPARPPRELGRVVIGLAGFADHQVGRIHCHRCIEVPRVL